MRERPASKGGFLYLVVALAALVLATIPRPDEAPAADAERSAFDLQMRALRAWYPRALPNDIVLVGIDYQTEKVFVEPKVLWHVHLAEVLHALAKAKPLAVGVDIVLPPESYDKYKPGSDLAMMRGILDLKRVAPLVFVHTVDDTGRIVPVQQNYRNIVRAENLGLDQQLRDPDGVSRRLVHLRYDDRQVEPTLVGRIAEAVGARAGEGFIDYSLGSAVSHVPIHEIRDWDEARLVRTFAGKVVLIGSLIGGTDRWPLPVALMEHDPGRTLAQATGTQGRLDRVQPGVLIHLQALRSVLGPGLLHPVPEWARLLLCALAALAVFVHGRPAFVFGTAVLVPAILVPLALVSVVSMQRVLPVASVIACFWMALAVRGIFDAVEAVVERLRLQRTFAGQVSPAVMEEMLGGSLTPGVNGQLAEVCILFSDVRGFTTLSENMPPEVVTTVLQRYFDRMVQAVHRYDGTVDKFIGDGMMVLFGAPRKAQDPCGDAVQCALAMLRGLDELNADFQREGLPMLTIGIGINFGLVTVGNIGSSERHNYSAIGDAVNVAARIEGLTKDLGRKILITEPVVSRVGDRFHFDALGTHKVKGHSPVRIWGIRTAHSARVQEQAEAYQ